MKKLVSLLLVDGQMERISTVAAPVPVYLINADAATVEKYRTRRRLRMTIEEPAGPSMHPRGYR